MAQVLQTLPAADPRRATYSAMLQTMAASLAPLEGSDGFWRASLADWRGSIHEGSHHAL